MEINFEALHTEQDFLKLFVRLGLEATRRLNALRNGLSLTWDLLPNAFFSSQSRPISQTSQVDYTRWLTALAIWAKRNKIKKPEMMSFLQANNACEELFGNAISRERIVRFYRRVWKTLGWDESIWIVKSITKSRIKEFYRRLRPHEVKRLVNYLEEKDVELRDMIIIGYYTGLRLSDVAELERREVDTSRHALKIVPNKVRDRKPRALTIPLVRESWDVVSSRLKNGYLFSETTRHRPSRKISKAFCHCRIKKEGFGRASFHSLRATFISLMDEAGVQPYITDAITGHADGGMHARYTQPNLRVMRSAVMRAIPPLC